MVTLHRFEDIEAWQKARELTREIYACSGNGNFAKDFGLCDQIRRASVSIMANIAEGFDRGGTKELSNFLSIAKGSVGEVEAQLYVALDQNYIHRDQFDNLISMTSSTKKLIAGFMIYLNQTSIKGIKFKQPSQKKNARACQPQTINHKP